MPGNYPDIRLAALLGGLAVTLQATWTIAGTTGGSSVDDFTSVTDYTVQAGDYLAYQVWADPTNHASAEIIFGLRNSTQSLDLTGITGLTDQDGTSVAELPDRARGYWVYRRVALPADWVGNTISRYELRISGANAGTYAARFRQVRIVAENGTVRKNIWQVGDAAPTVANVSEHNAANALVVAASAPAAALWTDLTPYLANYSSRQGRTREREPDEAGTMSLALYNERRDLEPDNTLGPFYPHILRFMAIRFFFTWASVEYAKFYGVVEQWDLVDTGSQLSEIAVEAVDDFATLSRAFITEDTPVENEVEHLGRCLDAAGWSATRRQLDPALSIIAAAELQNVAVLARMQEAVRASGGRLFMDGSGNVTYRNRHYSVIPPNDNPLVTFDNTSATLHFEDLTPRFDAEHLWNEVRVTTTEMEDVEAEQKTAQNSASITQHGVTLVLNMDGLILADPNEAQSVADFWANVLGGSAGYRYERLVLRPASSSAALWPWALGLELQDRVAVAFTRRGGGAVTQEVFIESVEIEARRESDWLVSFNLTPLFINYEPPARWALGTSALGTNTWATY